MDVHHLETSVRVHFYDILDFFYHCLLLAVVGCSRREKLYLPGDGVQERNTLHI